MSRDLHNATCAKLAILRAYELVQRPSISVSQYCRNGTHYVLLGSYMLVKWGFMGFSSE